MTLKNEIKTPAFVNDDNEEEINADFSIPVVVETGALDWQASPAAGVMPTIQPRRMQRHR